MSIRVFKEKERVRIDFYPHDDSNMARSFRYATVNYVITGTARYDYKCIVQFTDLIQTNTYHNDWLHHVDNIEELLYF